MSDRWCPTCRRYRTVEDTHFESYYEGGGGGAREYGYVVTDLECGHEAVGTHFSVGPAPGQPYAERATAASIRARDLALSRREEVEES